MFLKAENSVMAVFYSADICEDNKQQNTLSEKMFFQIISQISIC